MRKIKVSILVTIALVAIICALNMTVLFVNRAEAKPPTGDLGWVYDSSGDWWHCEENGWYGNCDTESSHSW
ncbi:MAG: hypothetical protein U9O50_04405 [Acidobacteriota bacterium]|nr:hypothetical protein [Acidobacteriota bacterium]